MQKSPELSSVYITARIPREFLHSKHRVNNSLTCRPFYAGFPLAVVIIRNPYYKMHTKLRKARGRGAALDFIFGKPLNLCFVF